MNGFDWTPILIIAILSVAGIASAFIKHAWTYYVGPWLVEKGLEKAAINVVYAVEALLGRYCGEDKWLAALEKMAKRGYNVDAEEVIDALKAAWKKLDLEQMIAGEKPLPAPEETTTE